eukprot:scaffold109196_cov29-Tisochrysis_lutea.AAC.1
MFPAFECTWPSRRVTCCTTFRVFLSAAQSVDTLCCRSRRPDANSYLEPMRPVGAQRRHEIEAASSHHRQGNLPLHLACIFTRCDIALALIDAGADPKRPNGAGELPSKLAPVSLRMKVPELAPTS